MRRRVLVTLALLAGALPAGTAHAQTPPPEQQRAELGTVKLSVVSGLPDGGRQYVMRGQRVTVRGTLYRFSAGQTATVEIIKGRRTATARAKVVKAGRGGAFEARFSARSTGTYSIRARVRDAEGATVARSKARARAVSIAPTAGAGSSGLKVRLLQRGLKRLGFAVPLSGSFDGGTARAVMAFRKTNSMQRTGYASRAIYSSLFRGEGAFKLRHPRAGKHVEFDWSRQVLVLARDGKPERVYHSSSGAPATPTVFGRFRFYRKDPGTNSLGMVHSSYFIGGYAIHGYKSVPPYPASHGCLRVPIPNALSIFRWIELGDPIYVYR